MEELIQELTAAGLSGIGAKILVFVIGMLCVCAFVFLPTNIKNAIAKIYNKIKTRKQAKTQGEAAEVQVPQADSTPPATADCNINEEGIMYKLKFKLEGRVEDEAEICCANSLPLNEAGLLIAGSTEVEALAKGVIIRAIAAGKPDELINNMLSTVKNMSLSDYELLTGIRCRLINAQVEKLTYVPMGVV